MALNIALPDYLEISQLAFEWAQSYDTKDWQRLEKSLAPSVSMDYTSLGHPAQNDLTPEEFAQQIKCKIGDELLKTQHFLGAAKWEQQQRMKEVGGKEEEVVMVAVTYQIRAVHIRYADVEMKEVVSKGHGLGWIRHDYRRIEGVWKIERVAPTLEFVEDDLVGTLGWK